MVFSLSAIRFLLRRRLYQKNKMMAPKIAVRPIPNPAPRPIAFALECDDDDELDPLAVAATYVGLV